jgi:predicted kinase
MRTFARCNREVLDRRAGQGRVRECHGDLRAEHVILSPELSVVDCVEFALDLRTLDVADDLAFLVMDLRAHDAEWVRPILVSAYRGAGGDCGADALVSFFAVHRALVRAKIQLVRAAQYPPSSERAARARDRAAEFIAIAERFSWRSLDPLALVACGGPATGKSFLAGAVAARAGAPVINSDVVRKELAGLRPQERAPAEVYSEDFNRRTYRELGRRTALALDAEPCVVVDATFRRRDDRAAFSDAFGNRGRLVFVQCLAPAHVVADRASARELDPGRVSDATVEIAEREGRRWEPLDEIEPGSRVELRTDRDVGQVVSELAESLEHRLAVGG